MGWKRRNGWGLLRSDADGLATVTAMVRRRHQRLLKAIVIAFRPAETGGCRLMDELLGRLLRALSRPVKLGAVLPELTAAMLRGEEPSR